MAQRKRHKIVLGGQKAKNYDRPTMPKEGEGPVGKQIFGLGIASKAERRLDRMNIPVPKEIKVDKIPDPPYNVSDISSDMVGDYLSKYEQAAAWCFYQLKKTEIDIEVADETCKFIYDKEVAANRPEGGSGRSAAAKANASVSDMYQRALNEKMLLTAQYKLVEASYNAFQRYATLMSREISRRQANFKPSAI